MAKKKKAVKKKKKAVKKDTLSINGSFIDVIKASVKK
jgi:hypothetical protein